MHKCLAHTPFYIEHHESSEYAPDQKRKVWLKLILQKSASSNYSTGWFQTSTKKYTLWYPILSK